MPIDEMMMVSRRGSPPDEYETEILYHGEPIEVSEIPKKLNFNGDSRKYFYRVHKINLREKRLDISSEAYLYDASKGCLYQDFHGRTSCIAIPFNAASKKGLLGFLENLQI